MQRNDVCPHMAQNALLGEGFVSDDGISVSDFLNACEKCNAYWNAKSFEEKKNQFEELIDNSTKNFGTPSLFFVNVKFAGANRYVSRSKKQIKPLLHKYKESEKLPF